MRFILTYEGPLRASQGDARGAQVDKKADQKQELRKHFHRQLKELWTTNKFLNEYRKHPGEIIPKSIADNPTLWMSLVQPPLMKESLANEHKMCGYRFVPLVREDFMLNCALNILFLRRDIPGSLIHAGDIDNRLKTLIDGLRMPNSKNELGKYEAPDDGEDPFFCLLRDDKNITALSVETDTLLIPRTAEKSDDSLVHLIITVELHPYFATAFNLGFS